MKIRASMVYDGKTLSVEYDHNSASTDSNVSRPYKHGKRY